MKKLIGFLSLFSVSVWANEGGVPTFFNSESNKEYIALIDHLVAVLPKNGNPEFLSVLASPYGLLDVQATKFSDDLDKNSFANFNMGVMGSAIFDTEQKYVKDLPNRFLCHQSSCRKPRLQLAKELTSHINTIEAFFTENPTINLVSILDQYVYRINNAFYTPDSVIDYTPSAEAGFVPSAEFKQYVSAIERSPYYKIEEQTLAIRQLMHKMGIKVIQQVSASQLRIIVMGISNNQWGIVYSPDNSYIPVLGERNLQGFAFDDVEKLAENIFYYQTN
ncbi:MULTISPECIES: hypothetical protein [Pseudoalteromonas]|uniref:Uncharacterized protein n=1 Tax=Pseudoalteromonas haloplanktis TaxID=228 RepID=A0ABU1BCP6_PSEHA|nr:MULTISPECIES: hypothetical protein [Pseudoalteromonas]MCF6143533.1 hypothetical protein [Pseudoalteromonas mariniglutinosa NCIMB 1770]MDQ9091289.1 hypothetical protein [Pseudoalteromonas haloplanktis]